MEYWQKRQIEAENRLRAALDKPVGANKHEIGDKFFNPLDDLMDGCVDAYSSEIDDLAMREENKPTKEDNDV